MSDREPTELYEILERFGTVLDGNDLSDLSRMCREYAVNVHETRLGPALAEQRMATDSWHKKFNDLNEESLRLFREVERLTAELESRTAPVEPPVLSRAELLTKEWLDALIDGLDLMRDPSNAANVHGHIGALLLRDAILESLSQEEG